LQAAGEIGISQPTVLARVDKLEKEGIIKSYSAMVNLEKLGYDLTAIIDITATTGKIIDLEKQIARFPNVCAVYDTTGLTNMIMIAKFKSRAELSNFVKRDLSLPYVERTNTHVVLTTVKEGFLFADV
jgi:DNA-binding Lrp family transcriptional regulator